MITTCNAKDVTVFDPWTADLPKLAEVRALCLQTIEARLLDAAGLRQVQADKAEIERAAKKRHGVSVWLV